MLQIIITLLLCYTALFLLSLRLKDNSIVDIFWGIGFVVIAWMTLFQSQVFILSQIVLTLLITAWGVRLALTIGAKKLSHSGEDRRYAKWRAEGKYFYLRSFFQVYLLQGALMLAVATPIFVLNATSGFESSLVFTILGSLIALFGLIYETIADTELRMFVQNKKKGEILTSGLRKFHRYPQYFGESVFWFGIAIIASQVSLWAFLGWGIITFLLRFVSGVPMMESHYRDNVAYQKYSENTPLLFPRWNKLFCKK